LKQRAERFRFSSVSSFLFLYFTPFSSPSLPLSLSSLSAFLALLVPSQQSPLCPSFSLLTLFCFISAFRSRSFFPTNRTEAEDLHGHRAARFLRLARLGHPFQRAFPFALLKILLETKSNTQTHCFFSFFRLWLTPQPRFGSKYTRDVLPVSPFPLCGFMFGDFNSKHQKKQVEVPFFFGCATFPVLGKHKLNFFGRFPRVSFAVSARGTCVSAPERPTNLTRGNTPISHDGVCTRANVTHFSYASFFFSLTGLFAQIAKPNLVIFLYSKNCSKSAQKKSFRVAGAFVTIYGSLSFHADIGLWDI
jgi:hypothetical protein